MSGLRKLTPEEMAALFPYGIDWRHLDTLDKVIGKLCEVNGIWFGEQPAIAAHAQPDAWKNAVMDELASHCIGVPSDTPPREVLQAIIKAAVQIALDPAVSSDAQELIDLGRAEAIDDAVARISATHIVEGQSVEQLLRAVAGRVADVAKPTFKGEAAHAQAQPARLVTAQEDRVLRKAAVSASKLISPGRLDAQAQPVVPLGWKLAQEPIRTLLQSMIVSATQITDGAGDVIGYEIKTGAIHKLAGLLELTFPANLKTRDAQAQPVAPPSRLQYVVDLVTWDDHGAVAPKEPYSWETIARMACDLAKYALQEAPQQPTPQHPVGGADNFGPDKAGCCGATVTQRCKGCPHDAPAPQPAQSEPIAAAEMPPFNLYSWDTSLNRMLPDRYGHYVRLVDVEAAWKERKA